jgi:hypothetical protein
MSNGNQQDMNKGWQPQNDFNRGYQPSQSPASNPNGPPSPGYQPSTQNQGTGGSTSNPNPPGPE